MLPDWINRPHKPSRYPLWLFRRVGQLRDAVCSWTFVQLLPAPAKPAYRSGEAIPASGLKATTVPTAYLPHYRAFYKPITPAPELPGEEELENRTFNVVVQPALKADHRRSVLKKAERRFQFCGGLCYYS